MPINVQADKAYKLRRIVETDVNIKALKEMTPSQLESHINAMKTLPELKDLVKQLACIVCSQ